MKDRCYFCLQDFFSDFYLDLLNKGVCPSCGIEYHSRCAFFKLDFLRPIGDDDKYRRKCPKCDNRIYLYKIKSN